jgi:surface antigen
MYAKFWVHMWAAIVVASLVLLGQSAALAAPVPSTHRLPGLNVPGVTSLCGPDPGYGCTAAGYAGGSVGWPGTKYGAGYASRNSYGYHNCTLYAAYRLSMNGVTDPGWSDNAIAWDTTAAAHGIPVDQTAAVGAVAQWNGSTGHVAYVDIATSMYIEVTADNYGGNYTNRFRIAVTSPAWPDNFIHFRDVSAALVTPSDGPTLAVGAHAGGEIDVFWRGEHGDLMESWYAGGRWWGPISLGMGPLASAPTVAVQANGEVDVFWRGANGHLVQAYFDGIWHGPLDLGAANPAMANLGSAPAATSWGSEVDVYWTGVDGKLWEAWWSGGAWHGPVQLAMGTLGSAPAVAAHPDGRQSVVWKGTDGNLWEASFASGSWSGPINHGLGPLGSAPTVNARGTDEIDVFWRGADGRLRETFRLGDWYGPLTFGFGVSAPAATAFGTEVHVFWRGAEGGLWQEYYRPGAWSGPTMVATRVAASA